MITGKPFDDHLVGFRGSECSQWAALPAPSSRRRPVEHYETALRPILG